MLLQSRRFASLMTCVAAVGCGAAERSEPAGPAERRLTTRLTFGDECEDVQTRLTFVEFRLSCEKGRRGKGWVHTGNVAVSEGNFIGRARIGALGRGQDCALTLSSANVADADWDADGERDRIQCRGVSRSFAVAADREVTPGEIEMRCRFRGSASEAVGGRIVDSVGPGQTFFVGPTQAQAPGGTIALSIARPLPEDVRYSWSASPAMGSFKDCDKYPHSCSFACGQAGALNLTLTAHVGKDLSSCTVPVECKNFAPSHEATPPGPKPDVSVQDGGAAN